MTNEGLTAKQIEHTKANPAKRVEVPVGLPRGLYLVVHPSGKKTWAFRYRWHGASRKLTFDAYPVMGLAAARGEANAAIKDLEAGNDPAVAKADENSEPNSAEAVAKEWIERDVKQTKTAYEVERIVNKEILPICKGKLIAEIARPDLMRLLDEIVDRGATSAANHTLSVLKRMFNWAIQRGYVEVSPAATIKKVAGEESRDRVLSEDELRDVCCAAPALGYPSAPFLQILMLTAQRRGEVAGMRWEDLDLDKAEWTIPKEETKSKRVQEVPLAPQVVEILRSLPRFEGGSHVFTTTSGTKPVNGFSKWKRCLDAEILKQKDAAKKAPANGFTMHDFRRTAATWLAQHGTPPHVLSAVLNHSAGSTMGVTQIYNRFKYGPERRAALEKWAGYVEGLPKHKQRKAS